MWLFASQDSTKWHDFSNFFETQKDRESTFRHFAHFEQENWLKLFVENLPLYNFYQLNPESSV